MKVVYNPKGFGLRLNDAEMRMFCALLGYTLCAHPKPLSSDTTWFSGVDWEEFRAEPLLVRLVEEGMLSNTDLAVREWEEDDPAYEGSWTLESDGRTYELVYVHMTDPWELPGYYDEEDETETQGETA
jgi:hypothetical protein